MYSHISRLNSVLSNLKIQGTCVDYKQHRHLAFFDVALESGATVRRIELRTREIALHLKTQTAPIVQVLPKSGVVRLRVALHEAEPLPFCNIYSVDDAPADFQLPALLGESDEGKRLWVDLARHPHTLVAGATGSGKSVFLRSLIANFAALNKSGRRKVQLFLADPKRVEFNAYENSLSGLIGRVTYDYRSTLMLLEYVHAIMEARYEALAQMKVASVERVPELFPSIVVVIDEVADLMGQDKRAGVFQGLIVKLAQKCRAAGIYLVLATQRPSVDVLTGLIKANFPARISFKVGQRVDSQVILDAPGAEALLGRGDAILQSPVCDRVRFQSPYIDAHEIVERYRAVAA